MFARVTTAATLAAALSATTALAAPITNEATTNGTVRPAGPRSGSSGTAFFNVEGSGNAANASYGTADFAGSGFSFGGTVTDITTFSLALTESNAAFTAPGTLDFFLASDATTPVTAGATSPNYVNGQNGAASVGTALGTLTPIGTGTFSTTGNTNTGQVDTYDLTASLTADAKTAIINALNGGSAFRLVVAPDTATTAATFIGATYVPSGTNPAYNGPTLTIDATVAGTPEPASLALLGLGGGLALRRRRA